MPLYISSGPHLGEQKVLTTWGYFRSSERVFLVLEAPKNNTHSIGGFGALAGPRT